MKKIAILGSTGSIGTQALEIISKNRDKFEIQALSCDKRVEILEEQIKEFNPKIAVITSESDAKKLASKYPKTEFYFGSDGLIEVSKSDYDILLNSLVGISGLLPTYEAVLKGKTIALANKETLVAGGNVIMSAVKKHGATLLPVDSEHNAIFQCLSGNLLKDVKKLILTASGGPFRGYSLEQLENVTLEQALNHPNWSMGNKITIDSATMMNKGLEIIEARWLFDIPASEIEVAVHPQSIVHSMVEYCDGSVMAQMGKPDMRVPISYALGYPDRIETEESGLEFFTEAKNLTFEKPDEDTFKCLKLARQVLKDENSSYAVVLNAANEVFVQLFLEKKISFLDIQHNIENMLETHKPEYNQNIAEILELDKRIRRRIGKIC